MPLFYKITPTVPLKKGWSRKGRKILNNEKIIEKEFEHYKEETKGFRMNITVRT